MTRAPGRARQRGFFDFSITELAIIFGLALVVLGPKKLPGLVQQIGRWVGRARHMARQFREQLEQEVNSINAVKPVPRHVAPDVGPPAPAPEPVPEHEPVHEPVHEAQPEAPIPPDMATVAPPGAETHPEAQIYFALNGTEPAVVAQNPHAPPAADAPAPAPAEPGATGTSAPAQPASVEVVFPHDHG
ncbi:MAG TPA: twin-arginine translocase TatA/TatE family subunit [Steroidobacteraceae bacterium]|nr:twin-arginine translocase TatA/TatE family subunit [Steroidobacteraceae bacterium]